jgi:DNA-binding transcriptional MocR family regulator
MSDERPERRLSPLFTWRGAIVESSLPPTSRHVALTLSLHMNERGGSCFPSFQTLAAETGLNYDTVRNHVRELAAAGWLVKETIRRGAGRGTRTEFTATIPSTKPTDISTGAENPGVLFDDHRGANAVSTGAQDPGHEDVSEGASEDDPPKPPSGGRERSRKQPPEPLTPLERSDDFDQWWAEWPNHPEGNWERFVPYPATWLHRGDYADYSYTAEGAPLRAATRRPCVLCGVSNPCVEVCKGVEIGRIDSTDECIWKENG